VTRPDLLLFVADEPETLPGAYDVTTSLTGRLSGMFLFTGIVPVVPKPGTYAREVRPEGLEKSPLSERRNWHLPPEQLYALEQVLEVSRAQGKSLGVIDVDRPSDQQSLVVRWVGSDDVLPILVREDGTKLSGAKNFTRAKLRRFLGHSLPRTR